MKTAFCSGGHVLVLASRHPPAKRMGSARVMHELLSCYDESSFTVLTSSVAHPATPGWKGSLEGCEGRRIVRIMWNLPRFWRLNTAVRIMQIPIACLLALYWVARTRPRVIFAVYPEIEFLCFATAVARIAKLPLKLYLLDLIPFVEERSVKGFFFRLFKRQAFSYASGVATISDGLSDFYARELRQPCAIIRHILPPLSERAEERNEGNLFLGGGIYAINLQSSLRVARAALSLQKKMVYTNRDFSRQLSASGLVSSLFCEQAYGTDADYQQALCDSDVLVLVLDWEEESGSTRAALETIFPTRTMEYLQAGVPILVHCPADFFLARFFSEHGCGVVVSERSEAKLARVIEELTADRLLRDRIVGQAKLTARMFAPENVSSAAKQFVEG
jgi:glycosyltransferase involved in cell wall biosynthesis